MAKTKKRKTDWTVESGRNIFLNGEPAISIGREGKTKPWEADALTHIITKLLNRAGREEIENDLADYLNK